jgi:hypothetical protein
MEVPRMCCFWEIRFCVYDSKISDYKGTVLAANLDKLIAGDMGRLMRPMYVAGDDNFRNICGKDGVEGWTQ